MFKLINSFVGFLLPFFAAVIWPVPCIHRVIAGLGKEKRVLLVARNAIAADHMACIADLLRQNTGALLAITTDRVPASGFTTDQAASMLGVTPMHVLKALFLHWDLIVFTNHPYGIGLCFLPFLKKVYVNHGIHTGKINNDKSQDGVYGSSKVLRPFGVPYYDLMFAASKREKEYAETVTPKLYGKVKVTGFLRADLFTDYANTQRSSIRKNLGYGDNHKVVHIVSTWGENSLYKTIGGWLLDEIPRVLEDYKFILSLHPRFDDFEITGTETRNSILNTFEQRGVKVNRGLDWEDYVVASDVAISDHSSLSLYHVLLDHPVMIVKIPDDQYVKGSTFDLLSKQCLSISDYSNLEGAVTELLHDHRVSHYAEISTSMLDYRGVAAQRYLKEFRSLSGV